MAFSRSRGAARTVHTGLESINGYWRVELSISMQRGLVHGPRTPRGGGCLPPWRESLASWLAWCACILIERRNRAVALWQSSSSVIGGPAPGHYASDHGRKTRPTQFILIEYCECLLARSQRESPIGLSVKALIIPLPNPDPENTLAPGQTAVARTCGGDVHFRPVPT